jgi:hypothetical protein
LALAENPNQQMADQIAAHLRQSGQLSHYTIAVKFKDGTAWLEGQVRDLKQEYIALNLALEPDGVERVVNNLTIASAAPAAPIPAAVAASAPAAIPVAAPVPPPPTAAPMKQASNSEPAREAKQADQAVTPPEETQPPQGPEEQPEQKESATRTPAQPPKPMFAFLDSFRRPSASQSQTVSEDEASGDTQTGARQVPASFAAAPAQRVAATEAITEPAPQPMVTVAPRPMPMSLVQNNTAAPRVGVPGGPLPMATPGVGGAVAPTRYDVPNMPKYAWPSYASYPNYAAVTYPRQYSATAWPYIGPFYPYPQVPLGWRKVTLQWDDGWWMLDFKDEPGCCWWR